MDSGATSTNSVGESVAESPAPASPPSHPSDAVTRGRGLRRWRRIPREHHDEGSPTSFVAAAAAGSGGGGGGGRAEEDLAQLHKRRLPVGADAPKGKQDTVAAEEGSPVASVQSSFAPPDDPPPSPAPTKLDPDLGFLIASAGFSVGAGGADSDNSDDRASKSSTTALPRHDFSFAGFGRERDRAARSRAPGAGAHGKGIRAARSARGATGRAASVSASTAEAENSRSSVESDLRSSGARQSSAGGGIGSNGVHKVLYSDDADHSDEEAPSVEARFSGGGFYKENGSVVGRTGMRNSDSDGIDHLFAHGSVGNGENGGIHSGLDPYVKSVALLRSAEEALENEIQKFVEIREETSENSTANHSETEWSSLPQYAESAEELSEKLKLLESKLEEASTLIDEKDSRILELNALNQKQPREAAICNSKLLSPQSDIDQLLMEKMEAEIQCFILTRASQAWQPLIENQITLFDMQKSLPEDHKELEVKLRHTENRALMLEEMVEKLETQCKDLSKTSEVLKLQARASRASLFCCIQLVLLVIAVGTFVVRFLPSSSEFVPT